jgi:hypothetical protein
MGLLAGVCVEEYLHSGFPDRAFDTHYLLGKTKALLIAPFMALRKQMSLYPCAERRLRLRPGCILSS